MNDAVFDMKRGDPRYPYLYRGLVEDNADPSQFGRLRIKVYPMFNGLATAVLPWVKPAFSLFDGAGSGTGAFCVPKAGTYVFVMFENGDINQPVYFAEAPTAQKGLPASRATNYPNRKVWNSDAIEVIVDDSNGDVIIEHSSGSKLTMDSTGKVEVEAVKVVLKSSDINLGDELGERLVKFSDIGVAPGGNLMSTSGGPCFFVNPLSGTQKVKGS